MATDANLIQRAIQGDAQAFAELRSRHHKALQAFVRSRVPAAEVADLVQEIEIQAWQHLDSFNGDSSFQTWLCSVAGQFVAKFHCRQGRRARMLAELANEAPQFETDSTADRCAKREQIKHCVACITRTLPLKQQIIMLSIAFCELAARDLAKQAHKSVRSVERGLHQSRATSQRSHNGKCALVSKTGIPKECAPPPPVGDGTRPAGRPPRRLIKWRDQLVRDIIGFDAAEAERLIATARNR